MDVDSSSELCGRCHTRDPYNRIMASNGYIRHHEQYDEFRHSPHAIGEGNVPGCNDCHDAHASVVIDDDAIGTGVTAACTDCHDATEYALNGNTPPHPAFVECTQCHMPKIGRSAKASDSNPKYVGDVASHIFAINSDAVNMEDGMGILADAASFIKTDEQTGLARITLDWACYRCHNDENGDGGGGSTKSLSELSTMADGIHPASTKSRGIASR